MPYKIATKALAIHQATGTVLNFTDEARLEHIDRLRKSLGENIYHVSAADLARKIIGHMMQL
jgi:hypothetical protein